MLSLVVEHEINNILGIRFSCDATLASFFYIHRILEFRDYLIYCSSNFLPSIIFVFFNRCIA